MSNDDLQALCTGTFLAGYSPGGGVYGPRYREDYGPPEQRFEQYAPWTKTPQTLRDEYEEFQRKIYGVFL